ncbi:hypothetical protein AVEN_78174-1 [Araneus ventricosus]|uniref:Ig-like domain-containing protein n=1 Tax=Araneus ventricosus TaxID=182803 RepID=A0A4Y2KLB7_ARAVE|nr:hypothetical protein AVEN_78174-1 [Araneus ventricosus]
MDESSLAAPLSTSMSPVVQKIHVGRPWVINCSVSGHPIHGVHWRKDVDVLSLDGRVSQISRDVIRIDPVQREDRGMYQCIAYNDQDTAQSAVELTLGGKTDNCRESWFHRQELQVISCVKAITLTGVSHKAPLILKLNNAATEINRRMEPMVCLF